MVLLRTHIPWVSITFPSLILLKCYHQIAPTLRPPFNFTSNTKDTQDWTVSLVSIEYSLTYFDRQLNVVVGVRFAILAKRC